MTAAQFALLLQSVESLTATVSRLEARLDTIQRAAEFTEVVAQAAFADFSQASRADRPVSPFRVLQGGAS